MMQMLIVHSPAQAEAAAVLAADCSALGTVRQWSLPGESTGEAAGFDLALLLLDPDFLSPAIEADERLDSLLARSTEDDFMLLPVVWEDCAWEESIYAGLKVLPQDKVPLLGYRKAEGREAARKRLLEEIQQLLEREHFRRNEPEAFARAEAKALKKGPGFYRTAGKLAWAVLPAGAKWGVRIGLGGLIGLIVWGLL
jgi:hypothetical protein